MSVATLPLHKGGLKISIRLAPSSTKAIRLLRTQHNFTTPLNYVRLLPFFHTHDTSSPALEAAIRSITSRTTPFDLPLSTPFNDTTLNPRLKSYSAGLKGISPELIELRKALGGSLEQFYDRDERTWLTAHKGKPGYRYEKDIAIMVAGAKTLAEAEKAREALAMVKMDPLVVDGLYVGHEKGPTNSLQWAFFPLGKNVSRLYSGMDLDLD